MISESDSDVLDFMMRSLDHLGYQVRAAHSCDETLALLADEANPIDLAIIDADITCSGEASLVDAARRQRAKLRSLVVSSTGTGIEESDEPHALLKPFGVKRLADAVRLALDVRP